MPTYKEALKKLKSKKIKPKKSRPKSGSRPRSGKKVAKKPVKRKPVKKVIREKPIKKNIRKKPVRKPIKRRIMKKARPRKKIIKKTSKKPIRKAKPKKIRQKAAKPRKVIKKRKSLGRRRRPTGPRLAKRKEGPIKRRPRRKKPTKPRVYIGKGTLDQLFESQAKVKLLRFFFRSPGAMFQAGEVFKKLRSNTVLLRQEMKRLEKLGLIKQKKAWLTFEKKRGGIRKEKKTVWHLNPGFDFLNELRDLVLKTAIASKSDLVEKARKIGIIKLLVLTGVFTGDETAKADLLIVGSKINQRKLSNFIKDLEAEVGKEINCAVMTIKEFDYRYDMYDRFVRDLLDSNCEILIKKVELW